MLEYLTRKDKPLSYFESHAGRGLYDLESVEAQRTGEAAVGIAAVERFGWFEASHPFMRALTAVRARKGQAAYPGSPLVAAELLRDSDHLTLAELHPQEVSALRYATSIYSNVVVRAEDGMALARATYPPTPRRGMMLVDPSYEVKSDYEAMPQLLRRIHKIWPVGVLALWYPILGRRAHLPMVAELKASFPDALSHEVNFPPAREGHQMQGSGMFIVNAPYGLAEEAARLSALYRAL